MNTVIEKTNRFFSELQTEGLCKLFLITSDNKGKVFMDGIPEELATALTAAMKKEDKVLAVILTATALYLAENNEKYAYFTRMLSDLKTTIANEKQLYGKVNE